MHGLVHELLRHVQDLLGHGGAHEYNLDARGQEPVDVVDLVLEAPVQHLVGLVDHEHLQVPRLQAPPLNHVEDPTGRPAHDLHAVIQPPNVLADGLAPDARVALHVHVVAQGQTNLLRLLGQLPRRRQGQHLRLVGGAVQHLQHPNAEDGGLARARLRLGDDVPAGDDGLDRALLDRARPLEAVGVDAPQQILPQTQRLEVLEDLERRLLRHGGARLAGERGSPFAGGSLPPTRFGWLLLVTSVGRRRATNRLCRASSPAWPVFPFCVCQDGFFGSGCPVFFCVASCLLL